MPLLIGACLVRQAAGCDDLYVLGRRLDHRQFGRQHRRRRDRVGPGGKDAQAALHGIGGGAAGGEKRGGLILELKQVDIDRADAVDLLQNGDKLR